MIETTQIAPATALNELIDFLDEAEAHIGGVYDDRAQGRNPTIGVGFNLREKNSLVAVLIELAAVFN